MIILFSIFKEMIQRIQSIYLLLVVIFSGGLIFVFPILEGVDNKVFALDLFSDTAMINKSLPILFLLSAVLALYTIFSFKDRKRQFVLGRFIILINLILLGLLIYLSLNLPGEDASKKGIGMFLPVLAILFSVLANKAIKKDEDLVKSVDRLR